MASDSASHSATATIITEEPMEKKVNDEIMEKETETVDVVRKDKPESNSIQIVVKEEQVDETLIDDNKVSAESKKESHVGVVEEVADAEESAEKVKDESDEKKEAEQVKEYIEEVNVEAVDDKKETLEQKSVETTDMKIVDVSKLTDEARLKHEDEIKDAETVSAAYVEIDTAEVKLLEVESKPENEPVSEVEVKAEENSKTKEEAEVELQVKLEDKTVETKGPEEVVLISQDLVSEPKKETEEVANSSSVEKISAKADHVVKEPSKNEDDDERKDQDLGNKTLKEDESIKKAAEKVVEALETEHEVKESGGTKQEEEVGAKEVGVKPKHSNNIISKVKQSLVKAKKAIIGKSTSSKTTSTEAKEEIKVK